MKQGTAVAIRFTDEDLETMAKLEKLTGLSGPTAIIRMALREALAVWQQKRRTKK
jgi:hypothetical protein